MNNYDYFDFSKNNPEEIFDPYYTKGILVIPENANTNNQLTLNNARMIECITAFKYLNSKQYTINDHMVIELVSEIIEILDNTKNINYSAFSQFFMVYNTTYSYFKSLKKQDKIVFIYTMLLRYCKERHELYLSHGYSNSILQVMSDNYSHKRNSKTTIQKILSILNKYNLKRIGNIEQTDLTNYYFLPDKGDFILFEEFLNKYNLKMESRAIEQNKLPDIVFNCNGHYYICELKTMKGKGGGQNKQIVELAYFIKFSESDSRFHYISFLDGDYANTLLVSDQPKVIAQRQDIINSLKLNDRNYFVNTSGFKKLITDIFE